jgi:zinc protease
VVFSHAVDAALSRNSPRRQPETPATVGQWDLAKAMAFYKARFADASNFTFVFVGSFTVDAIKPLVETYVASLPATHARETWRDLGIQPPAGVVEKTVEKGVAPKSQVAIVFSGPFEYDDAHRLALQAVQLVVQSRLFDTIRQELGGTYSIETDVDADKFPKPVYTVRIDWTCDPAKTAMLVQRVFDEVESVRRLSFSPRQVTIIREAMLRDYERNSQDNAYLLNQLAERYANGESADLTPVVNLPSRIGALTADSIQQALQTYLNTGNYVRVTLVPERR